MNKELAKKPTDKLTERFGTEQMELIKNVICKNANLTNDETKLFLAYAKQTKLSPILNQLHIVKRNIKLPNGQMGERATIQTGIDGLRAIASRTGLHAGTSDIDYIFLENGFVESATVTVYKMVAGVKCDFKATAYFKEFCAMFNGKVGKMWGKMPKHMIGKCAEALALRKAFPDDMSGLYIDEEMNQADTLPAEKISEAIIEDNGISSKLEMYKNQAKQHMDYPALHEWFKAGNTKFQKDLNQEDLNTLIAYCSELKGVMEQT